MSRLGAYAAGLVACLLSIYALFFYALVVAFPDDGTSVLSPGANAVQLLLVGAAFLASLLAMASALDGERRSRALPLSVLSVALLGAWAVVFQALVGGSP